MLAAGDELDAPIARLDDGEIAVGVRGGTVGVVETFFGADDEAAVGLGFAFVVTGGGGARRGFHLNQPLLQRLSYDAAAGVHL